jgi:hypothetical protein
MTRSRTSRTPARISVTTSPIASAGDASNRFVSPMYVRERTTIFIRLSYTPFVIDMLGTLFGKRPGHKILYTTTSAGPPTGTSVSSVDDEARRGDTEPDFGRRYQSSVPASATRRVLFLPGATAGVIRARTLAFLRLRLAAESYLRERYRPDVAGRDRPPHYVIYSSIVVAAALCTSLFSWRTSQSPSSPGAARISRAHRCHPSFVSLSPALSAPRLVRGAPVLWQLVRQSDTVLRRTDGEIVATSPTCAANGRQPVDSMSQSVAAVRPVRQ